jgi:hypothetical protein
MKKISLIFLIVICSCNSNNKQNIKDDLLYKDSENNIFLKRQVDLMSEKKPLDNQERYYDRVLYKDSAYMLKDIVDFNSFHFIRSVIDTSISNKSDIFEDKNYIYKFQHLPPTSPEIKVIDK